MRLGRVMRGCDGSWEEGERGAKAMRNGAIERIDIGLVNRDVRWSDGDIWTRTGKYRSLEERRRSRVEWSRGERNGGVMVFFCRVYKEKILI